MADISIGLVLTLLRLLKTAWKKIVFTVRNPFSVLRHIQNIKWWRLSWDFRSPLGMSKHGDEPIYIGCLQAFCENKSKKPIQNISGYIISNITGVKLPLTMEGMAPEEAAGIPAKCKFFIQALFRDTASKREGIVDEIFMKDWGDFTFVFNADEKQYKFHFGKSEITSVINQFRKDSTPMIKPKITKKETNDF